MLPWASFPKRFSTDVRFAPRNGALGCSKDGCLRGPAREARTRSGGHLGTSVSIEVCWSFGRPSSRRSCHIAVRHPVARSHLDARGSAFLVDFDHLASATGFSRQALRAGALRVRTFPWGEKPTVSAFPAATPLQESRTLSGKPERTRSSRGGTLPVPFPPPASLPSGRGHLRAMAPEFTQSRGHTRRV
jgi:hypothetical protein